MRTFAEDTLVLATHNQGKLREIKELLADRQIEVLSAAALGLDEPEETETSFTGNARLKARAAAQATSLPALADDSGLVVEALNGDPGIYSARWAGPEKDFAMAMQLVEQKLAESGSDDRRAHFICSLSLVWPDGFDVTVEGRVDGTLVWPPRGSNGFGYDPMFIADGYDQTFGEMDPALKHAIGHRADAFDQLLRACFA
ncbi:MAG: RdgB/HAM1 family non-canonical purine NTP pyrophosphatase [Alphaproteobacteria bacterium]|jgi:XTP/dITP diphosphohydrolase